MTQRNFRILLLTIIALVYAVVLLFVVSPESYERIVDFHFWGNRSFSKKEEREFDKKIAKNNIEFFKTYFFNEEYPDIFLLGFGKNTRNGKWTHGNLAKISVIIPPVSSPIKLHFKSSPYINIHNPKISVEVYVNNIEYAHWNFEMGKGSPTTVLTIHPKHVAKNNKLLISFKIDGMKSPHELGYGNNIHKLGLFFEEMTITPK